MRTRTELASSLEATLAGTGFALAAPDTDSVSAAHRTSAPELTQMSIPPTDIQVNSSAGPALVDADAPKEGLSMAEQARPKTRQPRRPTPAAAKRRAAPSAAPDDRKKQILKAAVLVFADKGYHGTRISDVADRAGVAYGLVYHYFGNKEQLLRNIFSTNWAIFAAALEDVADQEGSCQQKIRQIVEFMLHAFELNPLIVKVLVLEFGRNSRLGDALEEPEVARVFRAVLRILTDADKNGELQTGLAPRPLAIILLGALEAALASFVLPSPDEAGVPDTQRFAEMRSTLLAIVERGFLKKPDGVPSRSPAPAPKKKASKATALKKKTSTKKKKKKAAPRAKKKSKGKL
jgi:TetR/AcrR family fatty acid metabolism transcriptional regulator